MQSVYSDDALIVSFAEMLNREVKAAGRGGYALTLLGISVLDAAGGHDEDKLREMNILLSKILKTRLRDTDSVFLHSDRELIVFLPFTGKTDGERVCDKVREIFEANTLITSAYPGCQPVIAAVTFPDDGKIRDRLLELLLQRLEEEKEGTWSESRGRFF